MTVEENSLSAPKKRTRAEVLRLVAELVEQRYATQRVLPQSGFELWDAEPSSEEDDGARLPVCRAGLMQVAAGPVRASRGRDLKRARCETVGQFSRFDNPGLLQQLPVAYELFFGDRRCVFCA
jgi:hypothetical protein